MRIGIDACFMTEKMTGIGVYIFDIVNSIAQIDTENEYYMYLNRKCKQPLKLSSKWTVRDNDDMNFLLWQIMVLPKLIEKDEIDVFWEPCNRIIVSPHVKRIVLTVHDLAQYLCPKNVSLSTYLIERLTLKKSCFRADRIIAVSEHTKNSLLESFNINSNKVKVILNGVDINKLHFEYDANKWEIIKRKYKIDSPFFLVIGTIVPRKNCKNIFLAYEEYRRNGGRNKIVFAGKDAWPNGEFKKMVDQSEFSDDIYITGYVLEEEKKYLYSNTEALIFVSRHEGFGYPILEAFYYKSCVITSAITALSEVGGDAAIYLNDVDDVNELNKLMLKIDLLDENKKRDLVEMGLKQLKLFSIEDTAKQTLEYITQGYKEKND